MSVRLPRPSRSWISGFVFATLIGGIISPTFAHLTLIRQELESANSLGAHNHSGRALASGDFNGDGFDDLAIGAPDDDKGVFGSNLGSVSINYGMTYGLTHELPTGLPGGLNLGMRFGLSLAAGDFDNDGFDDLVVGAPFAGGAGSIWWYRGGPGGPQIVTEVFTQEDVNEISELSDRFGWSFAVGKFNGDIYDDLAIGGPGEDGGAGIVFYLFGSNAGLTSGDGGWFRQDALGSTIIPGDSLGYSLAAGDFLDGTHDDLAVGVPFADVLGVSDAGRIYVVPGSPAGLLPGSAVERGPDDLGLHTPAFIEGRFGLALAPGHFMADTGALDLAVGIPGFPTNLQQFAGRVVVIQLTSPLQGADSLLILQEDDDPTKAVTSFDEFGSVLSASDMNLDGFDELAVGLPLHDETVVDTTNATAVNAGLVQIFFRNSATLKDSVSSLNGDILNDVNQGGWRLGAEEEVPLSPEISGYPGDSRRGRIWTALLDPRS